MANLMQKLIFRSDILCQVCIQVLIKIEKKKKKKKRFVYIHVQVLECLSSQQNLSGNLPKSPHKSE